MRDVPGLAMPAAHTRLLSVSQMFKTQTQTGSPFAYPLPVGQTGGLSRSTEKWALNADPPAPKITGGDVGWGSGGRWFQKGKGRNTGVSTFSKCPEVILDTQRCGLGP